MECFVSFVFPDSAETDNGCGGKLDSHSIASCVRNICVKNYKNLIILLQVTIENVRDVFFWTRCTNTMSELQSITCHIGSHSVTCHQTQINMHALTSARQGW